MDETTKVIRIVVDSSRAVDGSAAATRALQNLETQAAGLGGALSRMEKALGSIGSMVKAHLALYVAELATRFAAMAGESLAAAGNLGELAEQMGVTTRGLQALQFAAVQNNLKFEELQTGVSKFSQKIGEAANGSKPMIDALDRLNVKILDANGKLIPTETNMQRVAAAILAMEDPAKRSAAQVEWFGKAGTKMAAALKDIAEGFDTMGAKAQRAGAIVSDDSIAKLDALGDRAARSGQHLKALFAENAAGPLTSALEGINGLMAKLAGHLSAIRGDWAAIFSNPNQKTYDAARVLDLQNKIDDANARLAKDPGRMADRRLVAGWQRDLARAKAAAVSGPAGNAPIDDPDGIGIYVSPQAMRTGASNPTSTEDAKVAESFAEKLQKLKDSLGVAAAAQLEMTKAARAGDVAFQEQQAKAEALAKAIDTFGGKLDVANPKVRALAAELEKPMLEKLQGQAAQNFVVATTELAKQNELLSAQIALMNETPEIQARELAIIKAKQEAQRAGNALTAEDVENRRRAIEENERLKIQGEQLKRSQELWTEPLKQALRDIQSTAAGAFDSMLANGNVSFQSLGDAFKVTIRRMIAEFMALATVRPIMSVVVEGLSNIGLVSQSTAAQLGYGNVGGGGGGFSLPQMPTGGMSGLTGGGMLGSFGDWLNTPMFGASYGGAGSYASIDALLQSGAPGLTPLGAFGGLASIGMGAYSLFSGRGSTGSVVGGLSGILGGGLGMAAALIPGMAALGPIGMGIGLLGGLLGGFLGGGSQEPPLRPLNYSTGFFRFNNATGKPFTGDMGNLNGGSSLSGMGDAAQTVLSLIRMAGGTPVPGKLYGGGLGMGIRDPRQGDKPYFNVDLVNPDGSGTRIADDLASPFQNVMEFLISKIFKADALNGGIKDVSPSLVTALNKKDPNTLDDTKSLIEFVVAFDKLGKAANPVKDAITALTLKFDDMRDSALDYGLSLDPINAEQKRLTKRTAQDFIDNMLDPMAVQLRTLDDERKSAISSAEYIRDHIEGVYVDMDRIATYYTNKEAALRNQFYAGAVTSLQNLINRLTYGDLANASPTTTLSGTRATYTATLAQARAGDASAITNLPGIAEAYATTARGYFASSPEYEALRRQIMAALQEVVAQTTGGAAGAPGSPVKLSPESQTLIAANDQLREMVRLLADKLDKLSNDNSALVAQLRAKNSNGM